MTQYPLARIYCHYQADVTATLNKHLLGRWIMTKRMAGKVTPRFDLSSAGKDWIKRPGVDEDAEWDAPDRYTPAWEKRNNVFLKYEHTKGVLLKDKKAATLLVMFLKGWGGDRPNPDVDHVAIHSIETVEVAPAGAEPHHPNYHTGRGWMFDRAAKVFPWEPD